MNLIDAITLVLQNPKTKITHELSDSDYIYYDGIEWNNNHGVVFDRDELYGGLIEGWEIYEESETKKMVTYYMPLVYYRKDHGVFPYDGGEYKETQELDVFFGVSWDIEVIEWSIVEAPEVM